MLELTALEKALDSLENSISFYNLTLAKNDLSFKTIRSGVIQDFEVLYEVSWKMLKRWLETNVGEENISGISRKELFRIASENGLISSTEYWFQVHTSRNMTSHTYNQVIAKSVVEVALKFPPFAKELLEKLKAKND